MTKCNCVYMKKMQCRNDISCELQSTIIILLIVGKYDSPSNNLASSFWEARKEKCRSMDEPILNLIQTLKT